MKKIAVFILLLVSCRYAKAQDPSFSQFFSSPLNVNPALTARINSDWRAISNLRGPMDWASQSLRDWNYIV
jgi:hypothetical protein